MRYYTSVLLKILYKMLRKGGKVDHSLAYDRYEINA
jgi:hypothetical protein